MEDTRAAHQYFLLSFLRPNSMIVLPQPLKVDIPCDVFGEWAVSGRGVGPFWVETLKNWYVILINDAAYHIFESC